MSKKALFCSCSKFATVEVPRWSTFQGTNSYWLDRSVTSFQVVSEAIKSPLKGLSNMT
jgi:hypothetical protein